MLSIAQKIFKILIVFLTLAGLPGVSVSEDGAGADGVEQLQEEADSVRRKMRRKEKKLKAASRKEKDVLGSLDEIDRSLSEARKRVADVRDRLSELDKKIAETSGEQEAIAKAISENEALAAKRLSGLYKLGNLGRMHLLAGAESMTDFCSRRIALRKILEHDASVIAELKKQKAGAVRLSGELAEKKKRRLTVETEHQKAVEILSRQKKERHALLASIRKEKKKARSAVSSLKKAAKALNEKIKTFKARNYEYADGNGGGFPSYKGLLNIPVKGKIVSFFGPYKNDELNVMNFRSGIDIRTERGSPVRVVYGGEVIYADWFRGYGNMMIVDHGHHYYTVYAHNEEMFKRKGDRVKAGEVIGSAGDSGSISGPGLHFEVRHHGKPVDPMVWLKKG